MSTLPTRTLSAIVANIAAGMQGRSSQFLNFKPGSVLLAISQSFGGAMLWLQGVAITIVNLTRLATSSGSDVDSFIADFPLAGVQRLGAQAATGLCTFARYVASPTTIYIPVGAQVKTSDGTQAFAVYADATNGAFVPSYGQAGGYALAPSTLSVQVPVASITPGTSGSPGSNGNVAAGAISLISTSIPGIDTVANPGAFTNGIDQETDASVKNRFQLAVQGRGGGTVPAIQSAIANLRVGMQCQVLENQDYSGATDYGMVTVIVDDGSGDLSASLLAAAQAAVESVRSAGIRVGVYAATTTAINVIMKLDVAAGYVRQTVVAQVSGALALYINGLGEGVGLNYFDLPAVAKTVPGCAGVTAGTYTLNGGTADIVGSPLTTLKAGSLAIS